MKVFERLIHFNSTTGINNYTLNVNSNVDIFPNPFSTRTTLQTDNPFRNATLIIYNIYGQAVKQINNISGQTITLHSDNLPSGFYFLQLTQDNQVISLDKLVITD